MRLRFPCTLMACALSLCIQQPISSLPVQVELHTLLPFGQPGRKHRLANLKMQAQEAIKQHHVSAACRCGMGSANVYQPGPLFAAALNVRLRRLQEKRIRHVRAIDGTGAQGYMQAERLLPCSVRGS